MEGKDITLHKILKEFKKPVLVDNRNWRKKVPIVDKYFNLIEKEISQFPKEKGVIVDPLIVENANCAVCNEVNFRQMFIKKGFYYACCRSCGHIYVKNPLKETTILQLYQYSDADNVYIDVQENEVVSNYQKKQARKYISLLEMIGVKYGNLLDIGCGGGNFLKSFKNSSFNLYGIEINKKVFAKLKDLLGEENIYCDKIENIDFGILRFNVVVLWGVLEHLANPISVLCHARKCLEDDGYMVACIPNIYSRAFKILGTNTPALNPRSHLQMYTKNSFGKICERAGLEVVDLFCELPVIDLMYDHIEYNSELIDDIIDKEESYYFVYLIRKNKHIK